MIYDWNANVKYTRRDAEDRILDDGEMALHQLADYWNMVQVKCDYCRAEPLTPCKNRMNGRPTVMPHFGSRQDYGGWVKNIGARQADANGAVDAITDYNKTSDTLTISRGRPA